METTTSTTAQLISRLQDLLEQGKAFISQCPEAELSQKPAAEKWSKKEILGHLIDSALHNLQRFTEIQFEPKPYVVRKYNQNELVKVHHYQQADIQELLKLWLALNERIVRVMEVQSPETLSYPIDLGGGNIPDLNFLIEDYVAHLAHHLKQIMND